MHQTKSSLHLIHSDVTEKQLAIEEKPIAQPHSFKKEEPLEKPSLELIEEKKVVQDSNNPLDIIQKRLQEISGFKKEEVVSQPVTSTSSVTVPEIIPVKEEVKPSDKNCSAQGRAKSESVREKKKKS
jgi:hypothetical protein